TGASGGDDAWLALLAATRRVTPADLGTRSDPATVARVFLASLFDRYPEEGAWAKVLARGGGDALGGVAGLRRRFIRQHAAQSGSLLSLTAFGDLVLAELNLQVEGDPDTGWRAADGMARPVVYLIREGGQPRVLGT